MLDIGKCTFIIFFGGGIQETSQTMWTALCWLSDAKGKPLLKKAPCHSDLRLKRSELELTLRPVPQGPALLALEGTKQISMRGKQQKILPSCNVYASIISSLNSESIHSENTSTA